MVIATRGCISLLSVHIYSKKKKNKTWSWLFIRFFFFNLKFYNTTNIFRKKLQIHLATGSKILITGFLSSLAVDINNAFKLKCLSHQWIRFYCACKTAARKSKNWIECSQIGFCPRGEGKQDKNTLKVSTPEEAIRFFTASLHGAESPWRIDQHLNFESTMHFFIWWVVCCQETVTSTVSAAQCDGFTLWGW